MHGIEPGYVKTYAAQYLRNNPWSDAPELQAAGYVRTDRSLDEYHRAPGFYYSTPLYNEWMKPQEFVYTLGTNLYVEGEVQTKVFIYRPRRAGEFSTHELNRFRWLSGHMANAVQVARRLALQDGWTAVASEVVDQIGSGVLFVDRTGHVIQANRFAESLLRQRDGLTLSDGRLMAVHRDDAGKLNGVIRAALDIYQPGSATIPRSINLRRTTAKRPLCVMAIPLPRRFDSPFLIDHAVAALIVTDPETEPTIAVAWLSRRYGLTDTEARLAQSLALGATLRQAAECTGITYETARWYLKNIFQKTNTTRQTELVRLLLSEQIVAGRD